MEQEKNICNFCGSTESTLCLQLKDHRLNLPGVWDLFQCQNCGLLYLSPQPDWDELKLHYPKKYHAYIRSGSPFIRRIRDMGVTKRVKSILNYQKEIGVLLDIGCATGDFLSKFQELSYWEVCGLEIVPDAAEHARQKGLKVFNEGFLDIDFSNEFFDVITMWDVLEHMPDPSKVLKKCLRILKPGGLLVIKTPDPSGGEARLFKENWVGYEAPQHLYGFKKNVLINKLTDVGFELIDLKQIGSDYSTFFLSTAYWLKEHQMKTAGDLLIKFIRTFIGRGISSLLIRPLRLFGLKSSCTYYMRKIEN